MPRGVDPLDAARLQGRLWTPDEIRSGLRLWVDSGDLPTVTFSSSTVSALANKIPGGPVFSPSSTAPPWTQRGLNGRPSMAPNNTGGTALMTGATPLTAPLVAVAAFQMDTTGTSGRILTFAPSGQNDWQSTGGCILIGREDNVARINTFQNVGVRATTNYTLGTPIVFSTLIGSGASATVAHYMNGAAGGTGNLSSQALSSGLFAIARQPNGVGPGEAWGGSFGGAVVYCGSDAPLWRTRIEGWMAWRWGLQSRLAASHPFRNAHPLIGG